MAFKLGKWWEDRRITCEHCDEVIQLDERDEPVEKGVYTYWFTCPSCGKRVGIRKV